MHVIKKWVLKISNLPALDKYVIFSITLTIVYTVLEFIFTLVTRISHDILTEYVYKFFAGEVIVCGLIKIFKLAPKSRVIDKLEEVVGFSLREEDTECDDGR